MVTETERLLIRQITYKDRDDIAEMLGDIEVMYAWEHAFSDTEIDEWIERRLNGYKKYGYDYFLAIDKFTEDTIGQIGLINEFIEGKQCLGIGWILNKNYWGKGYATEGAKALINYAFERLEFDEIIADIRPNNTKSISLANNLGMKKIGDFIKIYKGREMPHDIYVMKREFWEDKHSNHRDIIE